MTKSRNEGFHFLILTVYLATSQALPSPERSFDVSNSTTHKRHISYGNFEEIPFSESWADQNSREKRQPPENLNCLKNKDCLPHEWCHKFACTDPCRTYHCEQLRIKSYCEVIHHLPVCQPVDRRYQVEPQGSSVGAECSENIHCSRKEWCYNLKCADPCDTFKCEGFVSYCDVVQHKPVCQPKSKMDQTRPDPETECNGDSDCFKELTDPTKHENWHLVNGPGCGVQSYAKKSDPDIKVGEYPWLAYITIQNPVFEGEPTHWRCMGSIITHWHILTASWCFAGFAESNLDSILQFGKAVKVRVGEADLLQDPDCFSEGFCTNYVEYDVSNIAFLKDINVFPDKGKNMAMVTVKGKIEFNAFVNPICLEHGKLLNQDYVGERGMMASGWGWSDSDRKLQQHSLPILTPEENRIVYHQLPEYFKKEEKEGTFFCTGGTGEDSHNGADTGGPFMVDKTPDSNQENRFHLYGILSFKTNIEIEPHGSAIVYTKVRPYLQWILDKIDPDLIPHSSVDDRVTWSPDPEEPYTPSIDE